MPFSPASPPLSLTKRLPTPPLLLTYFIESLFFISLLCLHLSTPSCFLLSSYLPIYRFFSNARLGSYLFIFSSCIQDMLPRFQVFTTVVIFPFPAPSPYRFQFFCIQNLLPSASDNCYMCFVRSCLFLPTYAA